jgi:pentatricopeptide repeat protein
MVHTQLMRALCRAGKVEEAFKFFEQMKKEKVAVPTVNNGGENGEEEEEHVEYVEIPMEVDAVAYTTILKGLCGVGQLKRAMEIFDEMVERERKDGLQRTQRTEKGDASAEDDRKKPFECGLRAYTTMISGLVKRKHRMQEGQELDGGGSSGSSGTSSLAVEDDDDGWTDGDKTGQIWMLEEEEHQRNIEHAWSLFEEARRSGHQLDGRAYSTMLSGLGRLKVDSMRRAESLFREMERKSVRIDGQSYRAMIESCVNDCTSEGEERAVSYFENMMETWAERGIQDRDFAVVETLMENKLGEERWNALANSHRAAIEGIALGQGKTSMVRLPRMLRNRF